jgi:hypothetical protein
MMNRLKKLLSNSTCAATPWGIYQKILEGRVQFPSHFTRFARDIVRKLLQVGPN